MIADHSSAAFEYLLRDRPIVRIHAPALIALANIHPDYVMLLESASHSVTDVGQAMTAVERALADPAARSATRRAVAADLFYQPGTATQRCADALYEAVELASRHVSAPRTAALHEIDGERADAGSSVTTPTAASSAENGPRGGRRDLCLATHANRQRNHAGVQRRAVPR